MNLWPAIKKSIPEIIMPKKTFRVYHSDGKPEDIKGVSATIVRDKQNKMIAVKIGKRTIDHPIQFWELLEVVEVKMPAKQVTDLDDE
jgi:hypothetical protein